MPRVCHAKRQRSEEALADELAVKQKKAYLSLVRLSSDVPEAPQDGVFVVDARNTAAVRSGVLPLHVFPPMFQQLLLHHAEEKDERQHDNLSIDNPMDWKFLDKMDEYVPDEDEEGAEEEGEEGEEGDKGQGQGRYEDDPRSPYEMAGKIENLLSMAQHGPLAFHSDSIYEPFNFYLSFTE